MASNKLNSRLGVFLLRGGDEGAASERVSWLLSPGVWRDCRLSEEGGHTRERLIRQFLNTDVKVLLLFEPSRLQFHA